MKSKRLPICAGLLTEYHDDFIKYRHFIIQHLKYDTLEIVSGLHDGGCNVGEVIAIDYSCDDDALNAVRQLGIAVAIERYERIAARLLQRVYQSDGHNLVLWDVGGYASVVCADPELCSKVKFCIEDTNNGLWAYQREPQLFCPVVDVASIGNKHVENGYVGKKIVEGVLQFLEKMDYGCRVQILWS